MLDNKTILVTGGTGSFGREFIRTVLERYSPKKLVVYSRDEAKQFDMQNDSFLKKNKSILRYFIGDIRDKERVELSLRPGVDYLVHAAALKQVPTAEYNPFEAVKTNVLGSQNIIDASIKAGVARVVALSSDKAAAPINLYGATKLTSDKLFIAANNYNGGSIKLSVVRYGNVLGSRGSVVPYFLEKRLDGKLPITDSEMTRFSINLSEGVEFVIKSLSRMWGGEVFVPKLPSYRLIDLAKAILPDGELYKIGIRPGEKMHEEMITKDDGVNAVKYCNYYSIIPNTEYLTWTQDQYLKSEERGLGERCEPSFCYDSGSNDWFLEIDEIREQIAKHVPGGSVILS